MLSLLNLLLQNTNNLPLIVESQSLDNLSHNIENNLQYFGLKLFVVGYEYFVVSHKVLSWVHYLWKIPLQDMTSEVTNI